MDNTSGEGERAQVPTEIDHWNWGAFLLNWIWGIGNDTYIALLMFVPLVNVVMIFVLGAKGSVWAWRNRPWRDIEHFRRVQRKWATWGFVVWGALIIIDGGAFLLLFWMFTHTEPYLMAVERLATNRVAISELGTPIRAGFPWGQVKASTEGGGAELSFSASGPKANGTVYVTARKDFGMWRLSRFELAIQSRDHRIDLGTDAAANPIPQRETPLTAQPLWSSRAVLYEEDPTDPVGKQYAGSVTWRTETVSPEPGQPPDIAIRANITIPDRQMKVAWSLRRNTDNSLPASHTVDFIFTLPANYPHGEVANVPGLLVKQGQQARALPLAVQSVKVTAGYFLVGLSSVESDRKRNMQLLKDDAWFDFPIVYSDGRRAVLSVEKGPPGERAFADVLEKWSSKNPAGQPL